MAKEERLLRRQKLQKEYSKNPRYKELISCLCCENNNLFKYLDLGEQPLQNSFQKNSLEKLETYPLELMVCNNCWHSQLSIVVDPKILFSNYLYVSGTTQTLKDHFKDLVEEFSFQEDIYVDNNKFRPFYKNILDIGANDGSLLKGFKTKGFNCFGIDPAKNLQIEAWKNNIPILTDYFSYKLAKKINQTFHIITAFNVFAHNLNPLDFLKGCYEVLHGLGTLIIQFPHNQSTLELKDFGQFYFEHISYFTVSSFTTLAHRAGFKIVDIQEFPEIHGGSIRFYLKKCVENDCDKVDILRLQEEKSGLYLLETYTSFSNKINENISNLRNLIWQLYDEGYQIVAYGASAKSSTLFNSEFSWGKRNIFQAISYVVDDNPLKQNLYCPIKLPYSSLQIKSPEELKQETQKLAILMTTHNFSVEIKKKLKAMNLKQEIKLINYVPKVQIENLGV